MFKQIFIFYLTCLNKYDINKLHYLFKHVGAN